MSISLKQVAERVGVTSAAVSMALRGHSRISSSRREEIKRVAEELGYKPNVLARGLAGGNTHSVGIIMSGLCYGAPQATMSIARNLLQEAINRGYVGSIADSLGGPNIVQNILTDFIGRRFDGIFLQNGEYKSISESVVALLKQFDSVVVMTNKKESLPFDQIVHDREPAIKAVVEHLAKSGRCLPLIAGVYGPKAQIYARHFKCCGINVRAEAIIEPVPAGCNSHCKVLEEWLVGKKLPFDVIICNNDSSATAALSWLRSKGLNVPKDVAVIGFDNLDSSEYLQPPLASIDRNSSRISKLVTKMLFERLENPNLPWRSETVSMSFIHRESAG